jgi:hypothetical protein
VADGARNIEAREDMAVASVMGGLCLANAKLGKSLTTAPPLISGVLRRDSRIPSPCGVIRLACLPILCVLSCCGNS